jgi:hypothetical protein
MVPATQIKSIYLYEKQHVTSFLADFSRLSANPQLPEAGNFRVIISLTPPASEQRRVLFGPLSLANAL